MRLIRITTENNNCFFESVFNSDLIIKPQSKIALASFTTQLDNLNIVIDCQNNEISYTCDGPENIKTLTLPTGIYTASNVQDFWIEVTRIFNRSMENYKNQINRQWFCGLENGRATFKLLTGTRVYPKSPISSGLYVAKNLAASGSGGTLKRGIESPAIGYDSFFYIKSPNNKGCSSLRATIYAETNANPGFILGYNFLNPTADTNIILPQSIIYGIRYYGLGSSNTYRYIVNGIETDSDIEANLNDTLELTAYQGTLYFLVYPNTPNTPPHVLHSVDYNHQLNLFPLCSFIGSSTVINTLQFTSDPYYNITNTHTGEDVLTANNNIVTIPAKKIATQNFIQFNNPDLANILGYVNSHNPNNQSGFLTVPEPDFIADKPFTLRDFSESYVIELLNIKLNSMDSLSHGEKSILYIIPQLSAIKEHIVYQVPQLIFLNINNTYDLNLREIKARVLKDDLSQFRCYGLSEIVMIIKDKDEI